MDRQRLRKVRVGRLESMVVGDTVGDTTAAKVPTLEHTARF